MIDRRNVLAICGKALVASTGWLNLKGTALAFIGAAHNDSSAKGPEPMNDMDERMQADMKLLGTRVYSEEGIPMILACEDLAARKPIAFTATSTNAAVASAFRRYVDAWQRSKPDAPASDVPKLIELLAYRDFASGGSDDNL